MKLVEGGMEVLIVEHAHIKDALSRVVVEMIKREWPQQWPTLLTELSHACTKGCTQTELVLLVFLRLVEDVAVLQVNLSIILCVKLFSVLQEQIYFTNQIM